MLDWKEIKGYDKNKDYKWQEGVELPELNEEILIQVTDENLPDRAPFVGSFKRRNDGHVWMIISANDGMAFYEVQDGVKWARFNQKEGLIPRSLLRNKLFQDMEEVIY